jgi:hypothetical protein
VLSRGPLGNRITAAEERIHVGGRLMAVPDMVNEYRRGKR